MELTVSRVSEKEAKRHNFFDNVREELRYIVLIFIPLSPVPVS